MRIEMTLLRPAFVATTLACGFFVSGALALDANDFAQKLNGTLSTSGLSLVFEEPRLDGQDVRFSRMTFTPAAGDPQVIEREIVFFGVEKTADGGYSAETSQMDAFVVEQDDITVSLGAFRIENIQLPADAAADVLATTSVYEKIMVGPSHVSMDGDVVFSLEAIEASNEFNAAKTELRGQLAASGLLLDLAKLDPEDGDMALPFGLQSLKGNISAQTLWNIETGEMAIENYTFDFDNIGALTLNGVLHGYDLAVIEELYGHQQMVNTATMNGADADEIEALSLGILKIMAQKLSIGHSEIRFDDDGITSQIIASIAQENGTSPEIMASGMAATLPVLAAQFGAPEALQTMLMEAATAYLANPENISIRLSPENPVLLAKLAVVFADPTQVLDLVNLSISANQAPAQDMASR
jgi:hypothetical protein